ncbi:terpene synthase 10-like [Tripterygium wilfordii]|uniref:terpene synthase 10-like n=1 Tax=Tripterygium wilfordii TaxID=458696 RepID=UPI0018F7FFFA|nr:terpene synthase 10-like [Tripterygium wilfordii]XP_038679554.1 terpene synthase 10-like [Tripterygium wilfordii]
MCINACGFLCNLVISYAQQVFDKIPSLDQGLNFSSMALIHIPCALSISTISSQHQQRNHTSFSSLISKTFVPCTIKCVIVDPEKIVIRRSANYQPPVWDHNYIQSLNSEYSGGSYVEQTNKLKGEVKMMLNKVVDHVEQLELIDTLQRLGLSYHFEEDIKRIIDTIYHNIQNNKQSKREMNLYATSLEFRILRQRGYNLNQEVFRSFVQDDSGNFMAFLRDDIQGMLHLYEASFLMVGGETILEDAKDFASKHLEEYVKNKNRDQDHVLYELVSHALELPLHWRMLRLEARWFIDVYDRTRGMNPTLLEFAKLDFNIVQAEHQKDVRLASRWWRSTGVGETLSFARDRLMENFLWSVGMAFEPHFGYYRRMETRVHALLTALDDVYDVYGSLDELELFTDAIQRWNVNVIEELPDYMRIPFFTLYNAMNEVAFNVLKEKGFHVVTCLKKALADLFRCYLSEAKWFYSGYTPTLEEYMKESWISVVAPTMLVHTCLITNPLSNDILKSLAKYPDILRYSSMIVRLADDLGTSPDEIKRGDNPKSIQCYMHETGASEEEARQHIRHLISETWKKINAEKLADSDFSPIFIDIAINLARTAQIVYLYGDGHASQDNQTRDLMKSLFIDPIS